MWDFLFKGKKTLQEKEKWWLQAVLLSTVFRKSNLGQISIIHVLTVCVTNSSSVLKSEEVELEGHFAGAFYGQTVNFYFV